MSGKLDISGLQSFKSKGLNIPKEWVEEARLEVEEARLEAPKRLIKDPNKNTTCKVREPKGSSLDFISKPEISSEGSVAIVSSWKKRESYKKYNTPDSITEMRGMEQLIIRHICDVAQAQNMTFSCNPEIPNGSISKHFGITSKNLSMIISRLKKKGVIVQSETGKGRNGKTRYMISSQIYFSTLPKSKPNHISL